jgi:hypothetical protein
MLAAVPRHPAVPLQARRDLVPVSLEFRRGHGEVPRYAQI